MLAALAVVAGGAILLENIFIAGPAPAGLLAGLLNAGDAILVLAG